MGKLARLNRMRQERGVMPTLAYVKQAVLWEAQKLNPTFRRRLREDLEFDLRYGTDTGGTIYLDELHVSERDRVLGNRYEPAHAWVVRDFIEHLPVDLNKYAYVDLGSGKGRALLLAAAYPFARIVGVELAEELHAIAENNIGIYAAPEMRCRRIRSECMNADRFVFPGENLIVSVFNSFKAEVLRAVLDNLVLSLREAPRAAYFVYINPLHKEVIEASGLFEPIRVHQRYVSYAFCSPRLSARPQESLSMEQPPGERKEWGAEALQPAAQNG